MAEKFFRTQYIGRAVSPYLAPTEPSPNPVQLGRQQSSVVLRTLSIGCDLTTRPLRLFGEWSVP